MARKVINKGDIKSFEELAKKVREGELTYEEVHTISKSLLKKDEKNQNILRGDKVLQKVYNEAINMFIFSDPKYKTKPLQK